MEIRLIIVVGGREPMQGVVFVRDLDRNGALVGLTDSFVCGQPIPDIVVRVPA